MAGHPAALRPVLPDLDLDDIVARSRFLHERIERARRQRGRAGRTPAAGASPLEAAWREAMGGEPDCLRRRLAAEGLGDADLDAILDGPETEAAPAASWTVLLEQALTYCGEVHEALRRGELNARYGFLVADEPLPFEAAYVPFVLAARERLRQEAAASLDALSTPARGTCERELLRDLSQLGALVIERELALLEGLAGALPWLPGSPAGGPLAETLTAALLGEGRWAEVLGAYPVLARLLASRVEQWAHAQAELAERAGRCRAARARGGDRVVITAIRPAPSDPHRGGRSVLLVRFGPDLELAYKPRSLALERTFQDLLATVNRCGYSHPFRTLEVDDAGDHGWMEVVAPAPCRSEAEARELQHRLGGLLYLLALLQALDVHRENVVAVGPQPVIVDLETLFHPRFSPAVCAAFGAGARRVPEGPGEDAAWLETGILPVPPPPESDGFLDFSVLGAMSAPANGSAGASRRRDQDLVAGYGEMARLVCHHRATLRRALDAFEGAAGRILIRSTHAYQTLLRRSLHPELLRDGAARGLCFEVLRRQSWREGTNPAVTAVAGAELRALESMDVP